eukprot:1868213-Pleurochrysis_carterae.AAC.1
MTLKPTRMMPTSGTRARMRRRQRLRTDETTHGQKTPLTLLDPWFRSRGGNQTTPISDIRFACAKHQNLAPLCLRKPTWPAR